MAPTLLNLGLEGSDEQVPFRLRSTLPPHVPLHRSVFVHVVLSRLLSTALMTGRGHLARRFRRAWCRGNQDSKLLSSPCSALGPWPAESGHWSSCPHCQPLPSEEALGDQIPQRSALWLTEMWSFLSTTELSPQVPMNLQGLEIRRSLGQRPYVQRRPHS